MKKVRMWVRKNKKKFLITDIVLLLTVIVLLIAMADPEQVKGLTVSDCTFSTVKLNWDDAKNAKGYRVYRSRNGGDYEYLNYTTNTYFKDTKLRTGDTYAYAVVSRNGFLTADVKKAEKAEAVPSLKRPKLKVDVSDGEVKLSFRQIPGAISYEIVRNGEVIDNIEDTSYTDTGARSDKKYKYEVRAVRYRKDPVYSKFSNKVSAILHSVQNFKVKAQGNEVVFSWTPSDYYTTYKLYNGDKVLTETDEGTYTLSKYKLDEIYDVKLVGYAKDDSQSPENTRRFMIAEEPLTSEEAAQQAADWAVDIANDNSFSYGTGSRSHRPGCYFCGTNVGPNMAKKGTSLVSGHSYAKTYCCNPFVTAAYAHGAGDPSMLNACQHGKCVGYTPGSFYGSWSSIGKVGMGNLQPGDVLCLSAHVCVYVGDGKVAHAMSEGWGAGSVTVSNASGMYRRAKYVMRYTGNGSGVKTVIKDVDEKGKPIETGVDEEDA